METRGLRREETVKGGKFGFQSDLSSTQKENSKFLQLGSSCCQTDLEVSPSVGGGRCEVLVRATGLVPEGEARQGRPLNDSESGGAAPGFLSQLPLQTGRETTCGLEPEHALTGPAAGTALPC